MNPDIKLIKTKLSNDFPSLYLTEINSALKQHKNSYVATYYYLESQMKLNTLKIKKTAGKQKEINITNFNHVFKTVHNTIECSCCCDDKEITDFGHCTDGHLICKGCIKTHAENTIYQNLSCKVKCIDCNEKCYGTYLDTTLKEILSPRVFAEYQNLKKIEEIKDLCVDDINIKMCQHCGVGTDIGEFGNQTLLVCMECFKDTCLKCNQIDHPGKPCYYLGNVKQSKRQEIEDKMTEELILKCNKCKMSIFKNEGCNNVMCVCGTHNCYICKQLVEKNIGYAHFCTEHTCKKNNGARCDKCHLWEQNTKNRLINSVKDDYSDETKKLINGLL